jgi:hypothetical protein
LEAQTKTEKSRAKKRKSWIISQTLSWGRGQKVTK